MIKFNEDIKHSLKKICGYAIIFLVVVVIFNLTLFILVDNRSIPKGTIRLMYLLVFQIICYVLAERAPYKITSFILLFSLFSAFVIYPILPINTNPIENFFILVILVFVISLVPYLVYHIEEDIKWIIGWLAAIFIFGTFATLVSFKRIDNEKFETLKTFLESDFMLYVAYLLTVMFLNALFYDLRKKNFKQGWQIIKNNETLKHKLDEIGQTNESLVSQSTELKNLQNKLQYTNDHLEDQIIERIGQLKHQNKALVEYGFMNSKLVRSPINALKEVFSKKSNSHNKKINAAESIVKDLDNMTKSISKLLNEIQSHDQTNFK